MAAPGFGFSIGDFIATIQLIKSACNALKDSGGAKDEVQQVLADLLHLEVLFSMLNRGNWADGRDPVHLNAIKGMAAAFQGPLHDFAAKMEQYKALQDQVPSSVKGKMKRQISKVKWGVNMKEDVEKFRALVVAKIVAINALLNLHNLYVYLNHSKDTWTLDV